MSVLVEQSTVVRATIPFTAGMLAAANSAGMLAPGAGSGNNAATNNSGRPSSNAAQPGQASQPAAPNAPSPSTQATGAGIQQVPMNGRFGQAQIHVGAGGGMIPLNIGPGGQMPFQFLPPSGQGQHINFGGGGGFMLPDLSGILGPNVAAGVMNAAASAAAAGFNQARSAAGGSGTGTQAVSSSSATSTTNSRTSPAGATGSSSSGNSTISAGGSSNSDNLPQSLRNEFTRPPFDILLACHSHHGGRGQAGNRPSNFRQFVNVQDTVLEQSENRYRSPSEGFLLTFTDVLQQSNVLTLLQPILSDIITNYLMRGRDAKNSDHVRSCAKSLAKQVNPFLETFVVRTRQQNLFI
jgi:hypothetical protein